MIALSKSKQGCVSGLQLLGSTFAENTSYANHFNILQKSSTDIRYFPIRLCENGLDGDIANRVNDTCMDFSEKETKDLISKILKDIKEKI